MPDDQAAKTVRFPQLRPYTSVLWVLFLGLVVAFATITTQDRKIAGLTQDLAALRQESQKQMADLRAAQAASLEQDLLRLDQLTTQVERTSADEAQQAMSLANKTRADLARTVEQRHQEMITAIKDLRADLRSEGTRANQLRPAPAPDRSVHYVSALDAPPAVSTAAVSENILPPEQAAPPPFQKKGFWSKLNPFAKNKAKKQETAEDAPAQ
jgi:small-conductance mechanosensitive channel